MSKDELTPDDAAPDAEVLRQRYRELVRDVLANATVEEAADMKLLRYDVDGNFDYDTYREIQTLANKMKLDNQWVPESHVEILSRYLNRHAPECTRGICHGTRRGNEQVWFRRHLPAGPTGEADVIGTEISDTATDFPHTIQWDFHELQDDWIGALDFVYSNSWDHSFDPERAFRAWASCLRPGGMMLLDHGWNYQTDRVTAMDPFGITEEGLIALLNKACADLGRVVDVIDGGSHRKHPIRTIVFRAHKALTAAPKVAKGTGGIAVYSCYFGGREPYNPTALPVGEGFDTVVFTDRPDMVPDGVQAITLPNTGLSSTLASRQPKLMPERFFPDHDWVIYCDNRARLTADPVKLVATITRRHKGNPPAGRYLLRHMKRDCIHREARICRKKGFITPGQYDAIQQAFARERMPRNAGLFANMVCVQKMGSDETRAFNQAWYDTYAAGMGRDQIALPYVMWVTGHRPEILDEGLDDLVEWPVFSFKARKAFQQQDAQAPV